MKTKGAAAVIAMFPDGDGYSIEIENREEIPEETIAESLREIAAELAPEDRAKGLW